MTTSSYQGRRALLSVSDKRNIEDFARRLVQMGFEILSTGGTAKALRAADIAVTDVSAVTEFPEIMGGRVKTLHPKIHGGILGRRGTDEAVMTEHEIGHIDVVAVNLYPFQQTVAKPDCTLEDAIENIDIGGPAMVRAAAKNHASVSIVVDPNDYDSVAEALASGSLGLDQRLALARKAFSHTAAYDTAIANYLLDQDGDQDDSLPETLLLSGSKSQSLRYGENPHQTAAVYRQGSSVEGSLVDATLHQGKPLSYNNLADADAALACVRALGQTAACVIVKHGNPCGAAVSEDISTAYDKAFATDPTSAFGGIIAFNRKLDGPTAQSILDRQFVEVVIATELSPEALDAFTAKPNVRVLSTGSKYAEDQNLKLQRISGGLLVQSQDLRAINQADCKIVSQAQVDDSLWTDLLFAWRLAKQVKSNAIVYAAHGQTIGVGAGQMSRVISAKIAGMKAADAGLSTQGAVMASDAFLPFRDGVDAAADAGIRAIIQPGGSMRDQEVIDAANEHGMAMVFTGVRHFNH